MSSFRHSIKFIVPKFLLILVWTLGGTARGIEPKMSVKPLTPEDIKKLTSQMAGNKSLKARAALGAHYFDKKDYEKCIDVMFPVAEKLDRKSIVVLARANHLTEKYLNEIRLLEQWISRNPKDYVMTKTLGDAYLAIGNVNEASKFYEQSIAINKKFTPAYDALIELNLKQGNAGENRGLITDMVKIFGEKPKYLHALCEYYYVDGFLLEARNFCQRAVKRDPKYSDSHVILGLTYKDQENSTSYKRILANAAKQFPKSELAQFMAGQMSEELKDLVAAYKYYKQATIADRGSVRSWIRMGVVGVKVKQYESSLKAFANACSIDRSKSLDPFRTATSELRSGGVNTWYQKFDAGIQHCKYESNMVKASRVKDFTVSQTPVAEKAPEAAAPAPGSAPTGTATAPAPPTGDVPPATEQAPITISPVPAGEINDPTSGNNP